MINGENDANHRNVIYDETNFTSTSAYYNHLIFIMGDFNEVLCISETKGQSREDYSIREFKEWVEFLNLFDPLNGRKYTLGGGG